MHTDTARQSHVVSGLFKSCRQAYTRAHTDVKLPSSLSLSVSLSLSPVSLSPSPSLFPTHTHIIHVHILMLNSPPLSPPPPHLPLSLPLSFPRTHRLYMYVGYSRYPTVTHCCE